jgi:hypothetical protein
MKKTKTKSKTKLPKKAKKSRGELSAKETDQVTGGGLAFTTPIVLPPDPVVVFDGALGTKINSPGNHNQSLVRL